MLIWNPYFSVLKGQIQRLCNDLTDAEKFQELYKATRERKQKQYDLIMQQRKKNAEKK